jgi:hypothetical protein
MFSQGVGELAEKLREMIEHQNVADSENMAQ